LRLREESSRARAWRAVGEEGGIRWVKGTRGVGLLVYVRVKAKARTGK